VAAIFSSVFPKLVANLNFWQFFHSGYYSHAIFARVIVAISLLVKAIKIAPLCTA
jgi:cyclophilin family peptidyl-prolyl cis-trans isomerase